MTLDATLQVLDGVVYHFVGAIIHLGDYMNSGHYVTVVKCADGLLRYFSDDDEPEILTWSDVNERFDRDAFLDSFANLPEVLDSMIAKRTLFLKHQVRLPPKTRARAPGLAAPRRASAPAIVRFNSGGEPGGDGALGTSSSAPGRVGSPGLGPLVRQPTL